ncbi:MAG: hypothetical protein M1833_002275 [Piccolia ochrophora]|nr:MAG: hypothetical protein M1833_002275 [Piccolia ochrophora]
MARLSGQLGRQSDAPNGSWNTTPPTNQGRFDPQTDHDNVPPPEEAPPPKASSQPSLDPETLPHKSKSFSGIAVRAFLLGEVCASSALATAYLLYFSNPLWRASFFLASLSLFHFLEFWTTARYNTRHVGVTAFLLNNGTAYTIAHSAAFVECVVVNYLFLDRKWSLGASRILTIVGLLVMVTGQVARSTAMAQAGKSFNHIVQTKRSDEHTLITHGLYAYLRHPSYFGFFWWGLGTQLVMGNAFCFLGYAVILWRFFDHRISKEEEFLVDFFGKEYEEYKQRTTVGIPFIR